MSKEPKKSIPCPIVGTSENIDLSFAQMISSSACDEWCPGCDRIFRCQKMWDIWEPEDLFAELQRNELEEMLDEQITNPTDTEQQPSSQLSLHCEVVGPEIDQLPPEIQQFIRDLQRLIRRTQKQLAVLNDKIAN